MIALCWSRMQPVSISARGKSSSPCRRTGMRIRCGFSRLSRRIWRRWPDPADRDENPVRVFPTFTADLEEMARWLLRCRVTTVAMESFDHRHPADLYWRQAPRCSALSERQDAQASSPVVKADKQGRMKCLGPSLLDSALRCTGAARGHCLPGKRPEHEERARSEDRLA